MTRHTYIRIGLIWFFLFILSVPAAFSQSPSGTIGNWTMYFGQTRISDEWSIHTEFQYRSYEVQPNPEQMMIRGGLNYHISDSAFITAGYAYIPTYAFDKAQDGLVTTENRIWQQFFMRNNVGRFFFEHRYRLEQRWIETNSRDRYLNRVRYMIRLNIPINTNKMEEGAWFLSFYNEVFMNIVQNPFDRNRLYGAIGYQFSPRSNVQLGYMAQTVGEVTKPYLQLSLFYNIDLRKKE